MSILKKVFPKNKEEEKKNSKAKNNEVDNKESGKAVFDKPEDIKDVTVNKKNFYTDNDTNILVRPLFTEKALNLSKEGKYLFEVYVSANKIEVKNAIKKIYGIMPMDVNIITKKGKKTGLMRKVKGQRKDWKKAVVALKQGEKIDVYQIENKK